MSAGTPGTASSGVLQGVLKGNGNFVERFLSGWTFSTAPGFEEVRALVQGALSRRLARHYTGFASQQRQEWERTGRMSAKKLLYVLRTALTGTHVLRTAEVVTDVTRLLARYGLDAALELVAQKRRGEKSELPTTMSERWAARLPAVFALLADAATQSPLSEEPTNTAALEDWLIRQRLGLLARP